MEKIVTYTKSSSDVSEKELAKAVAKWLGFNIDKEIDTNTGEPCSKEMTAAMAIVDFCNDGYVEAGPIADDPMFIKFFCTNCGVAHDQRKCPSK